MVQLAFGVWDDRAYDNRKCTAPSSPPRLSLEMFESFNKDNPASIFLSDRGFLVFDENASLLGALAQHMHKVAAASCGKCSPCRAAAPLIDKMLTELLAGKDIDHHLLLDLAQQMASTSLCGIGQTGALPLIAALTHFPESLTPGKMDTPVYTAITAPCIEACPGLVNIPRYIDYIRDGHDDLAANTVLRHYPLVGSCGRVCVRSCESACRRGWVDQPISIRNLKRYAADSALASGVLTPTSPKQSKTTRVAVVGAGPVGLSCAYHLLERGYPVDIFEAKAEAGGMIRYGIPIYRLPKDVLAEETSIVSAMNGRFFYNQKMGRDFSVDDLFAKGYQAIFIACGCAKGTYLGMEGEDTTLATYETGIAFLERVYEGVTNRNVPVLDGDTVVVGGGNVAMDCCRAAQRVSQGTVHLVYRRTEGDAPCDPEEIKAAREEGVVFHFLCGQKELVLENGQITGLMVQDMERAAPDASGRRGVRPIPGSEHIIACRHVIAAIGQMTDTSMLTEQDGIERDRKGCIVINTAHETSRAGVFAGGDCTSGPRAKGASTMIMGMGQAYFAARSIDRYLSKEAVPFDARWRMSEWIAEGKLLNDGRMLAPKTLKKRVPLHELPAESRKNNFYEVEQTMSKEEAWAEASRCMRCYRVISVLTQKAIPGQPKAKEA